MSDNKSYRPRRLNFETVGSIAAMVVGVAALFVAWDQSRVMRAQQHASVWPILSIDSAFDLQESNVVFEFRVKNAGVGPAILQYAQVRNESGVLSAWADLQDVLPEDIRRSDSSYNSSIRGRVLSPGDHFRPHGLVWEDEENPQTIIRGLNKAFTETSLSICYCSVFDRCWLTSSEEDSRPRQVKICSNREDGID